jgi:hypothetical protein
MLEEEFERELKVLVVGHGGVGKTSLILQFCKGVFTDAPKQGVDFLEKSLFVEALGSEVRFMVWDTGKCVLHAPLGKARGTRVCVRVSIYVNVTTVHAHDSIASAPLMLSFPGHVSQRARSVTASCAATFEGLARLC